MGRAPRRSLPEYRERTRRRRPAVDNIRFPSPCLTSRIQAEPRLPRMGSGRRAGNTVVWSEASSLRIRRGGVATKDMGTSPDHSARDRGAAPGPRLGWNGSLRDPSPDRARRHGFRVRGVRRERRQRVALKRLLYSARAPSSCSSRSFGRWSTCAIRTSFASTSSSHGKGSESSFRWSWCTAPILAYVTERRVLRPRDAASEEHQPSQSGTDRQLRPTPLPDPPESGPIASRAPSSFHRLRLALRQLVMGLHALHTAGKLASGHQALQRARQPRRSRRDPRLRNRHRASAHRRREPSRA